VQKVNATPFRGARVRFRVTARAAAAPGDGNAAHVAVWIERPGKGRMPPTPVPTEADDSGKRLSLRRE
jgi:hypothetical protein